MPAPVRGLQQAILRDYAISVGLEPNALYIGGSRLRPLVPLDTKVGGIFITVRTQLLASSWWVARPTCPAATSVPSSCGNPDYQGEKSEGDWRYMVCQFEGLPAFFAQAANDGRYVTFTVNP